MGKPGRMGPGRTGVYHRPKRLDGIEAFHFAYTNGRVTEPPRLYTELILIPAILHTTTETYWGYPPIIQQMIRAMIPRYIATGWAGNLGTVKNGQQSSIPDWDRG